ncbi:hypothetical protein [Rhodocaloribacter sp.]
MIWMALVLAATAILAWLLSTLRKYEHESAAAALEQVTALREELDHLRLRVQALEAIAAADEEAPLTLPEEPERAAGGPDSVSSGRRAPIRP